MARLSYRAAQLHRTTTIRLQMTKPLDQYSYTFAHWLRDTRKARCVTYDKLVLLSGVSKTHLWEVEHGISNVTLTVAEKITEAFDTNLWRALMNIRVANAAVQQEYGNE